jgi:serine/threonine-protein kinase SRPK3
MIPHFLSANGSRNCYVALKVMTADALYGEKHIDELRILQTTNSTNVHDPGHSRIVQLRQNFEHLGPNGAHLCLVLELLGPSMSDVQRFFRQKQKAIPSVIVKRVLRQTLLGLDYLHHSCGIVHTGKEFKEKLRI